ncbi:hypothetical protein TNCV_1513191 [Trichonephila clavipes]|nr:hypothetical protein TNCV_1513191 [Trichonephila clavipes]
MTEGPQCRGGPMHLKSVKAKCTPVGVVWKLSKGVPGQGEHPGGNQSSTTSLPLPPTSRVDLWLDGYLQCPHVAQALHIYKHPLLLRDSDCNVTSRKQQQHLVSVSL